MIVGQKVIIENMTMYQFTGHADETSVCNAFSALICTFCETLKQEKPDLKFVFERRDETYKYENGSESTDKGNNRELNVILYTGKSIWEPFFETGIRLLSEETEQIQFIRHYG